MVVRPAFLVTIAASCAVGCCPDHIEEDAPCHALQAAFRSHCQAQGHPDECGLNGFDCKEGRWRGSFMYCNPSGPEPSPTATVPGEAPSE
jgi:hypothetical protein